MILREGRGDTRRCHVQNKKRAMEEAMEESPTLDERRTRWGNKTGTWITMFPSTVNRTELGAQEWRDPPFIRYGIETPDLPYHCDGYNANFSIFNFWIARSTASSWIFPTISVMGFLTLQENSSPPCTYATTPSSIKVVPWKRERNSLWDPLT